MLTDERGQAIILFVGIFSVILVIAAIVVDFGLWWAERRFAQRGVDLAAAAAAQDLPLDPIAAYAAACDYAADNGLGDADVTVEVFQRGGAGTETACGGSLVAECAPTCDTVRVRASAGATRLFTAIPFMGVDAFDVGAVAAAGLASDGGGAGAGADQAVLVIDSPFRLSRAPNCLPSGECGLDLAKVGLHGSVDALAGVAGIEVGYAPFTYCYQPAPGYPELNGRRTCVPMAWVTTPTSVETTLHSAIDATEGLSLGSTANICLGLMRAQQLLGAPADGRRQSIIMLTFGDNNFQYTSFFQEIAYPPEPCRPTTAVTQGQPPQPFCGPVTQQEREMDIGTAEVAQQLKNAGVEIYVLGLNVCSPNNTQQAPSYCAGIGDASGDNVANQRLLKCIASSPDHYRSIGLDEIDDALPDIASEIIRRNLLQ